MKNKTLLWIRLGILILFFIFILGISSRLIFNNHWNGYPFNFGSWGNWSEPALSESNSFKNVKSVDIDTTSYPIYFEEHDSDEIIVEEYILDNNQKNEIHQEGENLYFKQYRSFGFFNLNRGKIVIKVPSNSKLNYNINSVSGSVQISAASQNLNINTVSGSVKTYKPGENLIAETVSGSVKAYEPFKQIKANTVSGSVKVTANEETVNVNAYTISGSVKIALRGERNYTMDYSSTSGSVKDEYANTKYNTKGNTKYGNGTLKIEATTTSGSIKLTDW